MPIPKKTYNTILYVGIGTAALSFCIWAVWRQWDKIKATLSKLRK